MDEKERAVEKILTKSILAKITMICEKQKDCDSCPLREGYETLTGCLISSDPPMSWNLEKIAEVVSNAEI